MALEALRNLFRGTAPAAPRAPTPAFGRILETTVIVQCTVPANTPAGSITQCNAIIDPSTGAVPTAPVPSNEMWVIDDLYITGSGDLGGIDGFALVRKNFTEDAIKDGPLSSRQVSNPSRPRIQAKQFNATETLTFHLINTVAVGASPATVKYYLHLLRYVR